MSIDWFTTAAQIINFLILVWLLKKLLFKPIMGAMTQREQEITDRLQQADTKMSEAQALKIQYEDYIHHLQSEKDEILAQTRLQAENEKTELLQHLSEEIQQKKLQFDAEMLTQQNELGDLISRMIADKALALSDKVLIRLADQTLEQRIIEQFLYHLSSMPEDDKTLIKLALHADQSGTISTGFQMDPANRQPIIDWFNTLVPGTQLTFERNEKLLCGVALEAGGRSWEWNIERYLTELSSELLKTPAQTS